MVIMKADVPLLKTVTKISRVEYEGIFTRFYEVGSYLCRDQNVWQVGR